MTKTLRRALPLVAAITLVGSALMAGSGAALAGKPAPQIDGADYGNCWPSDGGFTYVTSVDLSANKGRWSFVTVTLEQEGEDAQVFYVDPPLKLENELERQVQVSPVATRKRATMTVTVTDRKGVPLEGGTRSVTTPEFCLYTD